MNIFQTLAVVLATSSSFLGIIILIKNRFTFINRLFAVSCFLGTLTLLTYSLLWWNPGRQNMILLNTISIMIVMFNFSVILHFLLELTNSEVRSYLKILLYVPAGIISIATVFSKTAFSRFAWNGGYWVAFPPYYGIWGLVFILFFYFLYPTFDAIILLTWSKHSRIKKDRVQGKIILFSLLSLFVGSFLTDFVLHFFDISLFAVGPLFGILYLGGFFYCLLKYQFLIFDISNISNEIITRMDDFFLVLNTDGLIIMTNDVFKNTFGNIKNLHYREIISGIDSADGDCFERLREGKLNSFKTKLYFVKDGVKMYAESFLGRTADKNGDTTGIFVISKKLPGAQKLKEKYNITDRQFELIDLSIRGLTNKEIGTELNLTRRTVETHFSNIYYKLSIKNKMELMKICKEFEIL